MQNKEVEKKLNELQKEIEELRKYKEYHEFAERQISEVVGEPITNLGDLADKFISMKEEIVRLNTNSFNKNCDTCEHKMEESDMYPCCNCSQGVDDMWEPVKTMFVYSEDYV